MARRLTNELEDENRPLVQMLADLSLDNQARKNRQTKEAALATLLPSLRESLALWAML
jgi:hypothetical protein